MRKVIIDDLSTVSRRELITKIGPVAGLVGLAGCTGNGNGDGDGDGSGDGNPTGTVGGTDTVGEPTYGDTLRAGIQPGVLNLDGRSVTGLQSMQVMFSIYSKLTDWRRDDNQLVIQSDLADEWGWETDTELVYELNADAVFHNGEPVTASDVKYTFDTMNDDPDFTSSLLIPSGITVEAVDEQTVLFDTGEQTVAPLESTLAFIVGIVNERADQEQDMFTNPVGSGPFAFEEWVNGSHIYVNRFEDYFKTDEAGNELPYLDRIEFNIYPNANTKLTAIHQGELDWIDLIPRRDVRRTLDNEDLVVTSTGPGGFMGIFQFNLTQPPFDDVNFRKAFLHAINWEDVIDIAYHGIPERSNNQPLPPRTGWNIDGIEDPYAGQNVELAQELMAESEIDSGFTFTNYVQRGIQIRQRANEIIQQQVAEVLDVDFDIQIVGASEIFQLNSQNEFGFSISGFNGMYDPDQILSANIAEGAFFNYGAWVNDEVQTLLREARQTRDVEARQEMYGRIYEINNEEAGKYYPWWDDIHYAQRPNIHGWVPKLSQLWVLENVWKEQ